MDNQRIVLNAIASGSSLDALAEADGDVGVVRPWAETDRRGKKTGRAFMTVNSGELVDQLVHGTMVPVPKLENVEITGYTTNATTALLKREDWLRIDQEVSWAAKQRLRLWGDIYTSCPYNIPNGMAVLAVQHTIAVGDASATISMDPVREGERSRPTLDIGLIPLPITHGDGSFGVRDLAVSRQSNIPLDTTNIQLTARKIAEIIEKLALGTFSTFSFNGGTIYGITNHPSVNTGTLAIPTGSNAATIVNQILVLIKALEDKFYYGPYVLYHSNGWGPYFDADYSTTYAGETLRTRLEKIKKISAIRNIDFLGDYKMVLMQMTPDVVQGVSGMPFTTVQWQERGGMESCFKVMTIAVPRVRADANGNLGITYVTAA